jgi:hypothetical protein
VGGDAQFHWRSFIEIFTCHVSTIAAPGGWWKRGLGQARDRVDATYWHKEIPPGSGKFEAIEAIEAIEASVLGWQSLLRAD